MSTQASDREQHETTRQARRFPGIFFDGKSPREEMVDFEVAASDLFIYFPERSLTWRLSDLEWNFEAGVVRATLKNGDEETVLEVHEPAAAEFLEKKFQSSLLGFFNPYQHRSGSSKALIVLILSFGVLAFGAFVFSRPLSRVVARKIPIEWEAQWGSVLDISRIGKTCNQPEADKILTELSSKLRALADFPYEVRVSIVDLDFTNAFALPGGRIVLTKKLIEEADSPDELIGVLGHEMGHIYHRHISASIVRSTFLTVVWNIALGDYSGALPLDPSTVSKMVELKFAREDEAQADDYAIAIFARKHWDPDGVAKFFERMSKKEAKLKYLKWISSHPMSSERAQKIKRSRVNGAAMDTQDLVSKADLEILRKACGSSEPPKK